ncbi:MAG: PadR family transcriptional regulator [Chloroflexota bacterium]
MSLTNAILGLLTQSPMTGYDLKNRSFDSSIAHFWPADQAQIYRTLDKMAEQGWVESQVEFQEERPNRKVYSITGKGRTELRHWLLSFQPLPPYREPFLIQLFFAEDLSNVQIITQLEAQRDAHRQRLEGYQQIPLPTLDQLTEYRETSLQRLTLEMGIKVEQAYLEWFDLAINTVRNFPEKT